MAEKPSDLSKAAKERLERQRIEQRYSTARIAIRWAGIAAVAFFIEQSLVAFAGRSTTVAVQAFLSVLANFQLTVAVALTGAATVWAICERALRRRKVESMQARIRNLEKMIDPRRTTSGLLPDGTTNPEDKQRS